MEGESSEERFLVLQKRLKEERLFVNNERNQLQELNKEVEAVSQALFYLEWKTLQQWINVDKVVKGGRVNPSECSLALKHIESVNFEDASIHLNYLDLQYGEFISSLKRNTDLVALIIHFYDINKVQKATIPITRNLLNSLYGNCIHKEDKLFVVKILNKLMELQIFKCEDLLNLFLGKRSNNAFATVFTLFYENLFSSKLYLTAALHGTVMQVILGDSIYLDVEVSKILSRLPPKTVQKKFGNPGTPEAQLKIKKHTENLHNNIIKLCKNFLKNLQDRVYCFPQSLRYSIYQLYQGMINKMNMPSINAKALISHILMSYFVCPAIINPEPYGINSDADISETARHNLGQVASVLRSLALLGCGLKDEKFKSILDEFEKGVMLDFATKVLEGAEEISLDSFVDNDSLISKNVVLLTEQNLKTLIASIKVLHSYNNSHNLQRNGLTALLNLLPKLPKHWNLGTQSSDSSETLVSIGVPNKERQEEAMQQLFVDLEAAVEPDVPVLVIPLSSTAESQVGMLSEGKVMGEESVESLTDKERRMRTSTLMHNALRQSLSMDDDSLDSLSNSSSKSPKNPDQIDNVFVKEKVKVVDNLINISDDIEAPKLPEKKHRPSLLSEKESLTDNSLPTPDDKRFSTCSMVGGPDGINSILQTATTQLSPATPAIPEGSDPWGALISQTTSNGFENSFENSFIPPKTPPTAPKSTARPNSLLPEDSIEPNYEKYSEKIIKEVSQQKTEQVGTPEEENMEPKFFRKKSHGTRLKDRISNKITTGMKQVKGNTLARLRDIPQQNKSGSVFTEVPANKVGTPFEASQKSRSLSLKKNESRENAGEAILEKYRSLALQSTPVEEISPFGTPPSSQMGDHNVYKEDKVAVFDKQFKFDDAKKKLRTFLSKTTSILLPSKSTSFDQLLLTMLQGKLAEAINMQDRSAVAQLHETLRSIKQLGVGSLEPLISQLEKDYKERSKYISYLIKCKQALLTTIADIEQLSLKLQRDKGICSKYFTTLSVRLFLETPERKSRCQLFRQKFVSTGMLDEKCDLLHDLLEELNIDLLKEPGWTDCSEEQQIDAEKAIERVLMSRIYRDAFHPNGETDTQNDKIFHDHIITLKEIVTLSHPLLQIPTTFQKEAPWPSAQTELLMVNVYKTAADKLACIHRCCTTIMNLLSMASDKQTPGADDFVPVLVYVVIQANPKNLISTKQYVNTFYETRLSGEEYYCWMQFCAAVEFIKTMRP